MKLAIKILIAISLFAYMTELGIGIFAGNYANIYHVVLPGYVQIHTAARYFQLTIWVKPWVAELHHWAISVLGVTTIVFLALGLVGLATRPRPPQP